MAELAYLQELRDIHLPYKVSVWPLAWGYWLILLLVTLLCISSRLFKPFWYAFQTKKAYLNQLRELEQNPTSDTLVKIALLLKQAALMNYPRAEVAALYGDKWLMFLSHSAKNIKLEDAKLLFSNALYQPKQDLDVKPALALAKSWLKQQRFRTCMN